MGGRLGIEAGGGRGGTGPRVVRGRLVSGTTG
jgi:hypothetical protein